MDRILRYIPDNNSRIKVYPLPATISPVLGLFDYLYDWASPYAYCGNALAGSLQTDSVWIITRIEINGSGQVIGTDTLINVKWTERTILF